MTGGHDSVMSICLACQVCNSSCRRSDGTFSTAVLCLRSISSESCDSEGCPFMNGWARLLHTQLWLRPNVTVATLAPARPMAVGNTTERAIHPTAWQVSTTLSQLFVSPAMCTHLATTSLMECSAQQCCDLCACAQGGHSYWIPELLKVYFDVLVGLCVFWEASEGIQWDGAQRWCL